MDKKHKNYWESPEWQAKDKLEVGRRIELYYRKK